MGHNVVNIVNITKTVKLRDSDNKIINRTKKTYPLFYVDLEPKDNNKNIYEITHLSYTSVKIEEPHKSSGIPQCKKCQRWNHTKQGCIRPIRCFKCAQNHESATCLLKDPTKFKCVNCGLNHTANYRGCQAYRDTEKLLKKPATTIVQRVQKKSVNQEVISDVSYASVAKINTKQQSVQPAAPKKNRKYNYNPTKRVITCEYYGSVR